MIWIRFKKVFRSKYRDNEKSEIDDDTLEQTEFSLTHQYIDTQIIEEKPTPIWIRTTLAVLLEAIEICISLLIRKGNFLEKSYIKEDTINSQIRSLKKDLNDY